MNISLTSPNALALLNSFERRRCRMAKADLNGVEMGPNAQGIEVVDCASSLTEGEGRAAYGRLVSLAITLAGMSDKEARVALGAVVPGGEPIDAGQFSRWKSGSENPQMWRFRYVPQLRNALRHAEAIDAGLRVRMVIEDDRRLA